MRGNALSSYYEKFLVTGEVKCIDEEIPFDLPFGWEWCRLRNLCTIYGRIGYRGYTKADMVEKGCGAISISPSNMKENGLMNFDIATYISWFKYEESPEIQIEIGDILVVKTGSSFGKTCIVKDLPEKATINPQIAVLKFVLTHKNWLVFALNAPFVQNQFSEYVIGTSIPTFSQEKLSSTLLPLPPFKEQQRIVDKIVGIIPIVEKYNNAQNELDKLNASNREQLKKSILQEAIQGKLVPQIAEEGTAQELLEQIRLEKQKLVKEGKLKKSALTDSVIFKGDDNKYYEKIGEKCEDITDDIPFEIPQTWKWCRFGTIVKMSIGKTPPRGEQIYWSNGTHNWVSISDMVEEGIVKAVKERVSDIAVNKIFKCHPSPKGSLLMSFKLTVGRTSILGIDAYHNEAIITIVPYVDVDNIFRDYLFYILPTISNSGDSKDAIKGKTLNNKSLNSLLIPLPPLLEQKRIVAKIKFAYSKIRGDTVQNFV